MPYGNTHINDDINDDPGLPGHDAASLQAKRQQYYENGRNDALAQLPRQQEDHFRLPHEDEFLQPGEPKIHYDRGYDAGTQERQRTPPQGTPQGGSTPQIQNNYPGTGGYDGGLPLDFGGTSPAPTSGGGGLFGGGLFGGGNDLTGLLLASTLLGQGSQPQKKKKPKIVYLQAPPGAPYPGSGAYPGTPAPPPTPMPPYDGAGGYAGQAMRAPSADYFLA